MPQPQLPLELLGKILEDACTAVDVREGRQICLAFCLVSKTFAAVARRKLYREVALDFSDGGDLVPFQLVARSERVFLSITSSPHLASLVSSLRLRGSSFGSLTAVEVALAALLEACANIRMLTMEATNPFQGGSAEALNIERMVAGLGSRLKSLEISRPSSDEAGLNALLQPLTCLEYLKLGHHWNLWFDGAVPLDASFQAPSFRLQHFSSPSPVEPKLLDILIQSSHPTLESLAFHWVQFEQDHDFSPFVALRTLELTNLEDLRHAHAIRLLLQSVGSCSGLIELRLSPIIRYSDFSIAELDEYRPLQHLPSSLRGLHAPKTFLLSTKYLLDFLSDLSCLPNLELLDVDRQLRDEQQRPIERSEAEVEAVKLALDGRRGLSMNWSEEGGKQ
ncbi:hypothetical protein BCR35DRAFT_195616 [Leucosporidium creatinivorum]|uniref:F-box domain-containing protein n=1 Tax=Leucosporidium creatinivorum TaxID=106004 RepID=A0A1Y2DTE2_9BASI|nr:hypothetical protein BCR35DRAFT_195616 [Leucosporidium creatinivorum]